MKTLNPYSQAFQAPKQTKTGYQFWGINLSNIPLSTTENQISSEFKKYGDIFSVKSISSSSMNIIFKSPKKQTSILNITNQQKKFKVTPLASAQLPVKAHSSPKVSKKSPVAKISLLKASKSNKFTAKTFKSSKLSSSAAPFTSPPRIIHTHSSKKEDAEGVFFEAICKSISHGTTEDQVLDFIATNIFSRIRQCVVKDGMMMLPGESMAVFELNNKAQIAALTDIITKNGVKNYKFNGNTFTLQRKTNGDDVATAGKLSLKLDEDDIDNQRTINSNGVNVVNDKNGSDYLMGFGFQHGLKDKDDKKTPEKKNFYFKLPPQAKKYVALQADSLDIPKTALVLMLGVLTTNGPIPISHYRGWKTNNPNIVGLLNPRKRKAAGTKTDIVPNLDALTDASDKNSDALSSHKSPGMNNKSSPVGSVGSGSTTLFHENASNGHGSKRSSPLNSSVKKHKMMISNSASSALMRAPLVNKGTLNKVNPPSAATASASAPAGNKRMFQYPNNSALGASSLFHNSSARNLLVNNKMNMNGGMPNGSNLTLISPRGVSLIRMKSNGTSTLLSPTAASILSPRQRTNNNNLMGGNCNAAPPAVVVPNTTDFSPMKQTVGNGFSMTTPIANITPVHIPYLGQGNQNGMNGQSPLSGFQSPMNYNINTPQSPLGNYPGITPIINAFTPTATGVNAITPTASLPFYWSGLHKNNNTNTMGNINMENDPLAPHNNIPPFLPQNQHNMNNVQVPNHSANPYVQKQLQNNPLLQANNNLMNNGMNNGMNNMNNNMSNMNIASSPIGKPPPSTFFKYPIPNEEPKSSPSNSNNIMNGNVLLNNLNNNLNNLVQQQSINSFTSNNDMNNINNNMNSINMNNINNINNMNNMNNMGNMNNNNNMDDDGMEERQMDEPPSLDEINNMRNIPSVISPNGTTPVVMITNLNEDEIDCDKIFTLCGVFGDVQRVKISYHKRDTAFVQLSNHRQAKHVVTSLNRMQLYGKMIHVNLSRMTRVKLPKDSPNSAMMFPDAKFLTKDYTNCKKHRYSKKGAGGIKYSPLSIGQPSHILHIANLPIQSEAKDLQEFLCGNGIFCKDNNAAGGKSRFAGNDKIQSIELIGVNNKLGSCQAFAKCHSVDIACQILIDFHSKEFLGREIKISFATRSHMPSDINKTHKTYSYSTNKKIGASINSIPSSIPRQNNSNGMNNNIMNGNGNNNSGDNMSSSSSSNGQSSHNSHGNNGYVQYNNYMDNRNGYNSNRTYNNQRNSYMSSYDNSVGYQTYNIVNNNKQPPPDQDKIFVRQHHHSGGRKYHYKLRINK